MDSDEESINRTDSGHNSPSDDEDDFPMETDQPQVKEKTNDPDEYIYEVLTSENILQTMIDCIDDVNNVLNVSTKLKYLSSSLKFSYHKKV